MNSTPRDLTDAPRLLADAFRQLDVRFYIGGSVASAAHSLPRTTIDADIVAAIQPRHTDQLAFLLGPDFHFDTDAAREAIRQRCSFSIIHLPKMLKLDIFPTANIYDRACLDRAVPRMLDADDPATELPIASAEDIILHKLAWFRRGGSVSERQWIDVLNVLKVQAGALDEAYMDKWAADLDLTALLAKAREEAKL